LVTPVPSMDLGPTDLTWGGDGAIYFDTGVKGEYHVFRIDPASHALTQVTSGPRAVRSPSLSANGKTMAYLVNDFTHLDDVYASGVDGKAEKKVSNHNAALMAQLNLSPVERMTYKGADGWDVEGFLVKPIGWQTGKKYPIV